ncbi:MAG TPA: hypothetical protein VFX48_03300, partial [Saprospiraceae bacterium]|nr:hypothetical protein [Saprospiraceae bacterium]
MRRNLLICMVLLSMVLAGGYLFLKHEKHQPKSKAAYSEAYQKEESFNYFNYRMLVDEFPFDQSLKSHYFREFIHHKSNLSGRYPYRQLPEWESLGPSHIAGRALCLAIHPFDTNQLWMGSAGSGLWKSETGGVGQNAWTHVPLTFPVSAVSSIAIQTSNPQIIYLGTGEVYNLEGADGGIITRTLRGSRGLGILKSTDGGKSWNISLDWSSSPSTA